MSELPTREQIEHSQRICIIEDGAIVARTALAPANAMLLRLMDLLPYVQHMPGCTVDLREMKEMDASGSRFQVTGIKKCNCNLTERLAALGMGERGEAK